MTLAQIGGVGGALAGEAQRVYDSLSPEEQAIARRVFLGLVQLGEEVRDTRRRAHLSELIASDSEAPQVRGIIARFAANDARFLTTSLNQQYGETIEVTHEALIRNWSQLRDWLNGNREALRQKQKIEQAAEEWKQQGKSKDYLFQGQLLRNAREFLQAQKDNAETALSSLAIEFVKVGLMRQRSNFLKVIGLLFVFALIPALFAVHLQIIKAADSILSSSDCKPDSQIKKMLTYMWWTQSAKELTEPNLCKENLYGIKFPGVTLVRANLDGANLANSDFRESSLTFASFKKADLQYANFSGAFLYGADFRCKDSHCTSIYEGHFEHSDLRESKFQGANLVRAHLEHADLRKADLRKANLEGASLEYANLSEAEGLTEEQLKNAVLCQTTMPRYLNYISENRNCQPK
jgi:uncharacterized protein YjbI with pentapeptide repeats